MSRTANPSAPATSHTPNLPTSGVRGDSSHRSELHRDSRVLVLEGGGMRGVYTAGVLEAFGEARSGKGVQFSRIVACSAGACAAASYLAVQHDRNRRVYLDFLDARKLVSFRRLLSGGNVMDIDYLVFDVTVKLCPLDVEALKRSETCLHIGVTDWETGEPRYLTNHQDDLLSAFHATCALPFFYRGEVRYQGRRYVDGGVSDPVPIAKAIELGATEIVVVLTSPIEQRGTRRSLFSLLDRVFAGTPALRRAMADRHLRYRQAAELVGSPPRGVTVKVVRPSQPLGVKRTTTDRSRLERGCDLGYEDGRSFLERSGIAAL